MSKPVHDHNHNWPTPLLSSECISIIPLMMMDFTPSFSRSLLIVFVWRGGPRWIVQLQSSALLKWVRDSIHSSPFRFILFAEIVFNPFSHSLRMLHHWLKGRVAQFCSSQWEILSDNTYVCQKRSRLSKRLILHDDAPFHWCNPRISCLNNLSIEVRFLLFEAILVPIASSKTFHQPLEWSSPRLHYFTTAHGSTLWESTRNEETDSLIFSRQFASLSYPLNDMWVLRCHSLLLKSTRECAEWRYTHSSWWRVLSLVQPPPPHFLPL